MRTAAWETAPQIDLRNCSKDIAGKDSMYVILVKGGVHATKHIFFLQKVSAGLVKLLIVMRNSRHREGF